MTPKLIELLDSMNIFDEISCRRMHINQVERSFKILSTIDKFEKDSKTLFFVCADDFEARSFHREFVKYLGEEDCLYYPSENLYFTFADSISQANMALRNKVCQSADSKKLVCISYWALCEKRLFNNKVNLIDIVSGEEYGFESLIEDLVRFGYEREYSCESKGTFSVRGGIVDVFPSNYQNAIRIEFFDDEVDSIRLFDVTTQRSLDNTDSVTIRPFYEGMLSEAEMHSILESFSADLSSQIKKVRSNESRDEMKINSSELLEKLSDNPSEITRLLYMYSDRDLESVIDLFDDPAIIIDEPVKIKRSIENISKNIRDDYMNLKKQGVVSDKQFEIFYSYNEMIKKLEGYQMIVMTSLLSGSTEFFVDKLIDLAAMDFETSLHDMSILVKQLPYYLSNEYQIFFVGEADQKEKVRNFLLSFNMRLKDEIDDTGIYFVDANLHHAVDIVYKKVLLIPFGSKADDRKAATKVSERKKDTFFSDIKPGDYVVHDSYGIGRYEGIFKLKLTGSTKDYLKITYAGESALYIPPEQMNLVTKYIGPDDITPKLSSLSSNEWEGTKKKVSKAVKKLADEYIQMYARRQSIHAFAYPPDSVWQSEFETSFIYEPTEGQLKATEEIKADMMKDVPMDRLLCGDVGYGKTEVAQRAAFKAASEGKQVAVLVPTTILALQHYNNFIDRFSGYPIRIEMLSRFVSPKKEKQVLEDLASGKVDIIIGTHKLLGSKVKFRDLGLLVIDEEQRFGVAHKDKLKLMKESVDTLTLSATPIPRTLHMSLIGIRDMSILESPPANKCEIKTFVMEENDSTITMAIRNELARNGQVFFVYNRVQGIEGQAERIRKLVPDANVDYAHGQMSPAQLESKMMKFISGETDVFVSTVIVENGVDITNANTIIILDADNLGLSQLYQLRGRVGRSQIQAYAYMMYKPNKALSDIAAKRLSAIKEFTKFGSGFKVAMRDLSLRGAGELLGANQHGHYANVGYEMYNRLLSEAVQEKMDDYVKPKIQCEIDLANDLYIPSDYIESEFDRIDMYKTISGISSIEDLHDVEDELIDRFGDIPDTVAPLLKVGYLKNRATKLDIKKIRQNNDVVYFDFFSAEHLYPNVINDLSKKLNLRVKSVEDRPLVVMQVKIHEKIIESCDLFVNSLLEEMEK